jgi:hypothetical protein
VTPELELTTKHNKGYFMPAPSNWKPKLLDLQDTINVGKLKGVTVEMAIHASPIVLMGLVDHGWVKLTARATKDLDFALEEMDEDRDGYPYGMGQDE